MAVSIPMDTFGGSLVALQRFDLLNMTLVAVSLSQALAWFVVLEVGGGLLQLGIVSVSISLIGQLVRYVIFRRLLPNVSIRPGLYDRRMLQTLAKPAGWYALGDMVRSFRIYVNVLVLSIVRNVATAGLYSVGANLALLGLKVSGPVTDLFYTHAAALVGRGDASDLGQSARAGSRLAVGITFPCCLVVALFARPALLGWVGPSFEIAAPAVAVLAAAYALTALVSVLSSVVSGSGEQRIPALTSITEGVLDIVLTAILANKFGLIGAAVASLISIVVVGNIVAIPILCRRLGISSLSLVWTLFRAHLPPLVFAGAMGWVLDHGPVMAIARSDGRLATLGAVVGASLLVFAAYGLVFACSGLNRGERKWVISRIPLPGRK
jgi:O-antigen/teichoic acid export membrane protein